MCLTVSDLLIAFNELRLSHPALMAGAEDILGKPGQYGFIADHKDGTVTKIFFRSPCPDAAEEALRNELTSLKLFDSVSIGALQIPRLIDDVAYLDGNDDFFACYRMTKIEGQSASWKFFDQGFSPRRMESHFRELGELTAEFHLTASSLDDTWVCRHGPERGGIVVPLPQLDARTNEALQSCDLYLQQGKKPAIIHGDLHAGNILVDDDGKFTGIIDFGLTGPTENHLTDFQNISDRAFPHFKKGYEEASGTTIDPMMMTMTNVSKWAEQVKYYGHIPARLDESLKHLTRHLTEAAPVTGYVPV